MPISEPIPVAQYLRVSTEHQRYSLENQHDLIAQYADEHGFSIVQTFADRAKSGLLLKNRFGLQQLLQEVLEAKRVFRAILVYDVSRWGRFQDIDEAGHYEFLCKSSGIAVHYCAEAFVNDGTAVNFLMKTIKRSMAAEYSRELGVKVLAGQKRVAALGLRVGGHAGYGLRRMLVSPDRRLKQLLQKGDRKAMATDRVVLVPGPVEEIECVRRIYEMVIEKRMCYVAIANELNRLGVQGPGSGPWTHYQVREIVRNPKYQGTVVYGRVSKRLRTPEIRMAPDKWVVTRNAFSPVIPESTYDEAHKALAMRTMNKSNQQLLEELRSILANHGKLTYKLIRNTLGATPPGSYRGRFGSAGRAYELIGYEMSVRRNIDTRSRVQRIRLELMQELKSLFPDTVTIVSPKGHCRHQLVLDANTKLAVHACRCYHTQWRGHWRWRIHVPRAENECPTALLLMNQANDRWEDIYLLPAINLPRTLDISKDAHILRMGLRVPTIQAFCEIFDEIKNKAVNGNFNRAFLRSGA